MKKTKPALKPNWLAATEKSLKITYWVTKIGLAIALAKQNGLLDWIPGL